MESTISRSYVIASRTIFLLPSQYVKYLKRLNIVSILAPPCLTADETAQADYGIENERTRNIMKVGFIFCANIILENTGGSQFNAVSDCFFFLRLQMSSFHTKNDIILLMPQSRVESEDD